MARHGKPPAPHGLQRIQLRTIVVGVESAPLRAVGCGRCPMHEPSVPALRRLLCIFSRGLPLVRSGAFPWRHGAAASNSPVGSTPPGDARHRPPRSALPGAAGTGWSIRLVHDLSRATLGLPRPCAGLGAGRSQPAVRAGTHGARLAAAASIGLGRTGRPGVPAVASASLKFGDSRDPANSRTHGMPSGGDPPVSGALGRSAFLTSEAHRINDLCVLC